MDREDDAAVFCVGRCNSREHSRCDAGAAMVIVTWARQGRRCKRDCSGFAWWTTLSMADHAWWWRKKKVRRPWIPTVLRSSWRPWIRVHEHRVVPATRARRKSSHGFRFSGGSQICECSHGVVVAAGCAEKETQLRTPTVSQRWRCFPVMVRREGCVLTWAVVAGCSHGGHGGCWGRQSDGEEGD